MSEQEIIQSAPVSSGPVSSGRQRGLLIGLVASVALNRLPLI